MARTFARRARPHRSGASAVSLRLPPGHGPFRSEDKLARLAPGGDPGALRRHVAAVEHVGRKQVQCISVRHPDRAYVTDNFTVTHNTMVALRAMLTVVDAGGQAALLAPTEVLAQQHHRSITEMMGELAEGGMLGGAEQGTKVVLLTGSMGAAARRQALLDLVTGEAGIVIGTHALIEDKVQLPRPRPRRRRRAAPLRRRAARRPALQGQAAAAPAGDDGDAHPAHRRHDRLRRPGDLRPRPTPGRALADRQPRRPRQGQAALPRPYVGARTGGDRGGAPDVRGLPAHRRRGGARRRRRRQEGRGGRPARRGRRPTSARRSPSSTSRPS